MKATCYCENHQKNEMNVSNTCEHLSMFRESIKEESHSSQSLCHKLALYKHFCEENKRERDRNNTGTKKTNCFLDFLFKTRLFCFNTALETFYSKSAVSYLCDGPLGSTALDSGFS